MTRWFALPRFPDHTDHTDLPQASTKVESPETVADANHWKPAGAADETMVGHVVTDHSAEQLLRQHLPRMYSLARRMLGNEAATEKVMQEVQQQVARKRSHFRSQAEATTWLHRVTVNCALLHRRRTGPCRTLQVRATEENDLGPGQPAADQERPNPQVLAEGTRKLIELAISRLPYKYRDAFVLSDIEGLANAEIGEILGLSVAAVKTRLHRAHMLLWDALAPHFCASNGQ
jgi:RNA polymerase sigma-70 factor (ECF subfamily)